MWLKAPASPAEDLDSVPSTHMTTSNCNSTSTESDTFFWSLKAAGTYVIHASVHTYM